MADQFQYVKMPDGSYGKFDSGASDDVIRQAVQKDFPDAYKPATPPAPQPSLWDRIKGIPQAYEDNMAPVNQALAPRASDGTVGTGARNVLGSAASTLLSPILHPVDTLEGALKSATPLGQVYDQAKAAKGLLSGDVKQNAANMVPSDVPQALETGAGQLLGAGAGAALGEGYDALGKGLKSFAAPDVPAQTMRGLRIPAGSKNANPILGKVDIAKPYLQGADSYADLQGKIKPALDEVYQPYSDFIEANRHATLGNSTVGDLFDRDKQITAQLGNIKNDPAAAQQAAQKGLTQADLMDEQKAIRAQLFPAAEDAGVKASEINKTYGALKSIQKQIGGKNTILVPDEPQGFGRMRNLSIKEPLKALDQLKPAAQDILNGRLWGGNPIDTAIQDAFKTSGPKPDLGKYTPLPRLALPAEASPDAMAPTDLDLAEPHGQVFPRLTASRLKRADLY